MTCFFIGGINRSGTTLLQSIFCSDKTTTPLIQEATYFRQILEAYHFGKYQFEKHNKYYFNSIAEMGEFTGSWAQAFIDKIRQRYPGADHVVLKHPPLTPNLASISEILNDVRFYVMVRDPRDVIASLIKVGERLRESGDPEGQTLPRNIPQLANYYMACYGPLFNNRDPDFLNLLTVIRYEDLVSDPSSVIDNIRKTSGLELEGFDARSDWQNNKVDFQDNSSKKDGWTSSLWGKGISSKRIGRYCEVLSDEEAKMIEEICAPAFTKFHY